MLNTLQRCETSTLLTYHLLEESAYHLVDGGSAPGGHGPRLTQEIFLDDQSDI